MSTTQPHSLAYSVHRKLLQEAARADHNLRLLVGHANLLDQFMILLATAEQEQERLLERPLYGSLGWDASVEHESSIANGPDESDADSANVQSFRQVEGNRVSDKDDTSLALVRTPSYPARQISSHNSSLELTIEVDSDSENELMPPSPPSLSPNAFRPCFPEKFH